MLVRVAFLVHLGQAIHLKIYEEIMDDENPTFNDRLWSQLTRWTSKIFSIATFDDKSWKKMFDQKSWKGEKNIDAGSGFDILDQLIRSLNLGSWNLKVVGRALEFQYKEAQSVSGKYLKGTLKSGCANYNY